MISHSRTNLFRAISIVALLTLLTSCSPGAQPNLPAVSTMIPEGAEGVAAAFLAAWERNDYAGMYSLLDPASQRLVPLDEFAGRYQDIVTTGTITAVHTQIRSALQTGKRATAGYDVTYDTQFLGSFTKTGLVMTLVYSRDGLADRWGVQWADNLILPGLAPGASLAMLPRWPGRANIKDRTGQKTLVASKSESATTVGIIPGKIQDEADLLAKLSPILNQSPEDIKVKYTGAKSDWFIPVGNISPSVAQENLSTLDGLAGVSLRESYFPRSYTYGAIAPHVLGYLGPIPPEQLAEYRARGYSGDEQVGLAGVEAWGESYLAGTPGGSLVLLSARGTVSETLVRRDPQQARNLLLTLDTNLQQIVQDALGNRTGAAVVMDVHTGDILATVSNPSFSPAIFEPTDPASYDRDAIVNDPSRPLLNRVTQGAYPLGSVFKIVTMAAALEAGGYTPETPYTCTGAFTRLGRAMTDWKPGGHGTISLRQALIGSCDPYFFDVGFTLYGKDANILPTFGRAFGFGQSTGIGVVAEESGIMPDPAWKLKTLGEQWYPGDSVNMAVGQGYVTVTPLQVVRMIAAVANGGTLYRPHLVLSVADVGGKMIEQFHPEPTGQLPVTASHLNTIREAMHGVTSDPKVGTATFVFHTLPLPVAGKTGTAENPGAPHAWFAGFAPADNPQIAIVVLVEHGGQGSEVSAPIFRQIVSSYFHVPLATGAPD